MQQSSSLILVIVYVDNIVVIGSSPFGIEDVIDKLSTNYLGKLGFFLEIEISYHDDQIYLSQSRYAADLLRKQVKEEDML